MIVKPKIYDDKTLGGYLLNDVEFKEELLISKKTFSFSSKLIKNNNNLLNMVNNLSSTPFKINTELLDFVLKSDYLLLDPNKKQEYSDLKSLTKTKKRKLKAYNSKVLLQETILEIVLYFKQFGEIYFPVRICQRGRVYTITTAFNYKSNELSRSLILFYFIF